MELTTSVASSERQNFKMKLLVNASAITSAKLTGIERFALRISQGLYRIDNSINIVSTEEIDQVSSLVKPRFLAASKRVLGRHEYLLRAVWDQTIFRHHVLKVKPDVVFFPIQDGMLFPSVKQVVTVHDLHYLHFGESLPECGNEISRWRKELYLRKLPRILNSCAAIIAVSDSTKNDLVSYFNLSRQKIHVVYNGYDENRFQLIEDLEPVLSRYGLQKGGYFLFVGSILRHKNLVRLVQAFARLGSDAKLVISGVCKDDAYLSEIINCARDLKLGSGQIIFLDYVSDSDLPFLYNGAISFVLPSLHEGFGVPVIEAMACGIPVVTSNCAAMPEVAGDAAIFIEPTCVDGIEHAMRTVLKKENVRLHLKNLGLERAKLFSWSASATKLYSIFEKLCVLD